MLLTWKTVVSMLACPLAQPVRWPLPPERPHELEGSLFTVRASLPGLSLDAVIGLPLAGIESSFSGGATMMRIGELGKKEDCLVQTVRFYESEGLLPEPRAQRGQLQANSLAEPA